MSLLLPVRLVAIALVEWNYQSLEDLTAALASYNGIAGSSREGTSGWVCYDSGLSTILESSHRER